MNDDSSRCRSNCPINFALETFGDKWTLLIIRDMMFKGKRRYGEFLASAEGISTNILASRLQRLEASGLIVSSKDPANRGVALYQLSPKGKDLLPVMLAITSWSGRYDALSSAPAAFLEELESDREGLTRKIRAAMEQT
ncbi:MAG: helix-turn-helix transcriptional regulator [Sulfuritalea sp.]|nr:helix-turn-helix transcriptional regulator [Sulfuritalea sp.]